jgi:hypothetical protein
MTCPICGYCWVATILDEKEASAFPKTVYAIPGDDADAPMIRSSLASPFKSLRAATAVPNWLDSAFVIRIPDGLFEREMSLYPDKYGMNTRVSININSVCTEAHE